MVERRTFLSFLSRKSASSYVRARESRAQQASAGYRVDQSVMKATHRPARAQTGTPSASIARSDESARASYGPEQRESVEGISRSAIRLGRAMLTESKHVQPCRARRRAAWTAQVRDQPQTDPGQVSFASPGCRPCCAAQPPSSQGRHRQSSAERLCLRRSGREATSMLRVSVLERPAEAAAKAAPGSKERAGLGHR